MLPGRYHMGLIGHNSNSKCQMWNTWEVHQSESAKHILEHVKNIAGSKDENGRPIGKLNHLVIVAHGAPAHLYLGKGIKGYRGAEIFSTLKGKVEEIWILGCNVAYTEIGEEGSETDGELFCSTIALKAGCAVIASTGAQCLEMGTWPYGGVDTYEGEVLTFYKGEGIIKRKVEPAWRDNPDKPGECLPNP